MRTKILQGNPAVTDIAFLRSLVDAPGSTQPEQSLELALLDYALQQQPTMVAVAPAVVTPIIAPADIESSKASFVPTPKLAKVASPHSEPKQTPKPTVAQPSTPKDEASEAKHSNGSFSIELWPVVLSVIKKEYNTLYGILRVADADYSEGTLTLAFKFAFHQKRINDQKNKKLITDIIHQQSGDNVTIVCKLSSGKSAKATSVAKNNDAAAIDTVSNIFGGAEVLES